MDEGKDWVSSQHQSVGQQITSDPLEKGLTRNTARFWWIALDMIKKTRELSEEARTRSFRKAPELGHAAKGGTESIETEESANTNLGNYC